MDGEPDRRIDLWKYLKKLSTCPPMSKETLYAFSNAVYEAYQGDDREKYTKAMRNYQDWVILASPPMYGDVVHIDHLYRGLFALQDGKIKLARLELLKAGRPPAGAVISSFGPNCLLARELLKVGEQQPVLDFLQWCKAFWLLPVRLLHLPKWERTIRRGGIPDFGGSLYYGLGYDLERVRGDYQGAG